MLVTWSKAALKARALVLTMWIALTAFGLFGASNLDQYLTTSLTVPGSSSAAANEIPIIVENRRMQIGMALLGLYLG